MTGDHRRKRLNRIMAGLLVPVFILLTGCGGDKDKPGATEKKKPAPLVIPRIETPEQAREYFQKKSLEIFRTGINGKPLSFNTEKLVTLLSDPKKISVRKRNLHACYKRVRDALTEEQQKTHVIFGKALSVGFLRDAWEIEVGDFSIAMGGCVEIRDGKIKVIWVSPDFNEQNDENSKSPVTRPGEKQPGQPGSPDTTNRQPENNRNNNDNEEKPMIDDNALERSGTKP